MSTVMPTTPFKELMSSYTRQDFQLYDSEEENANLNSNNDNKYLVVDKHKDIEAGTETANTTSSDSSASEAASGFDSDSDGDSACDSESDFDAVSQARPSDEIKHFQFCASATGLDDALENQKSFGTVSSTASGEKIASLGVRGSAEFGACQGGEHGDDVGQAREDDSLIGGNKRKSSLRKSSVSIKKCCPCWLIVVLSACAVLTVIGGATLGVCCLSGCLCFDRHEKAGTGTAGQKIDGLELKTQQQKLKNNVEPVENDSEGLLTMDGELQFNSSTKKGTFERGNTNKTGNVQTLTPKKGSRMVHKNAKNNQESTIQKYTIGKDGQQTRIVNQQKKISSLSGKGRNVTKKVNVKPTSTKKKTVFPPKNLALVNAKEAKKRQQKLNSLRQKIKMQITKGRKLKGAPTNTDVEFESEETLLKKKQQETLLKKKKQQQVENTKNGTEDVVEKGEIEIDTVSQETEAHSQHMTPVKQRRSQIQDGSDDGQKQLATHKKQSTRRVFSELGSDNDQRQKLSFDSVDDNEEDVHSGNNMKHHNIKITPFSFGTPVKKKLQHDEESPYKTPDHQKYKNKHHNQDQMDVYSNVGTPNSSAYQSPAKTQSLSQTRAPLKKRFLNKNKKSEDGDEQSDSDSDEHQAQVSHFDIFESPSKKGK